MPTEISSRVRRLAIQILDLAAFNYEGTEWTLRDMAERIRPVWQDRGLRDEACRLAWAAIGAVEQAKDFSFSYHINFAEAAGLLRDGWSPGEPVVRIGSNKENP